MAVILIVDDSLTSRKAIANIVEGAGHSTITASSGQEAIEVAKKSLPDLIVMDVMMDNMNGFEATRSLSSAEETASIPIIIVSGKDSESDKKWGLRQGAQDYIVKSADEKNLTKDLKSSLIASIKRILG